jgi:hypothetical protein
VSAANGPKDWQIRQEGLTPDPEPSRWDEYVSHLSRGGAPWAKPYAGQSIRQVIEAYREALRQQRTRAEYAEQEAAHLRQRRGGRT